MAKVNLHEFWEWAEKERQARNLSWAAVERLGGSGNAVVSRRASNLMPPTIDTCRVLAKAFRIDDVEVMRRAGLASQELPPSDVRERVRRQLDQMTEEQLKVVERTARALLAEQLLESLRAEPQKPQTSVNRP